METERHLDGQVFADWAVEAARHAAVVSGVDERVGAQEVVEEVAGQAVALLAAQAQGRLQDLHQLRPVTQQLLAVHTRHLTHKHNTNSDHVQH